MSTITNNLKNKQTACMVADFGPACSGLGAGIEAAGLKRPQCPVARYLSRFFYLTLLFCLVVQTVSHAAVAQAGDLSKFSSDYNMFSEVSVGFTVGDTFTSHLPLLVVEAVEDKSGSLSSPFLLTVYSGSSGRNLLSSIPSTSFRVLLTEEGEGGGAAKKAYTMEVAPPESGDSQAQIALAGLPEAAQWRLHGSARDKGMLRNGLAYAFGRTLFPASAPETRFCEVLFKIDGTYYYQGIYILAESVSQVFQAENGLKDGGFMLKYSPDLDKSRPGASQADNDESFLSKTLNDRGFSIIYPARDQINLELRAEAELDKLESVLHSLTPGTFLSYLSLMDQKSAIDLYILNQLMLNAEAAPAAFLLAGEKGAPLRFQPLWNFDLALDNAPARTNPLTLEEELPDIQPTSVLARKVPVWRQLEGGGNISGLRLYPLYASMEGGAYKWFDRLFLSRPFLIGMLDRYHELRRGPLAPEKVGAAVDSLARELGPALERDWQRWIEVYTANEGDYSLSPYTNAEGEAFIRQTASYDQELVKIRYLLRQQDSLLMEQITQLDRMSADLFDKATSGNRRAGYALATIVAFLFMTHLLTRKV